MQNIYCPHYACKNTANTENCPTLHCHYYGLETNITSYSWQRSGCIEAFSEFLFGPVILIATGRLARSVGSVGGPTRVLVAILKRPIVQRYYTL